MNKALTTRGGRTLEFSATGSMCYSPIFVTENGETDKVGILEEEDGLYVASDYYDEINVNASGTDAEKVFDEWCTQFVVHLNSREVRRENFISKIKSYLDLYEKINITENKSNVLLAIYKRVKDFTADGEGEW